MMNNRIKFYRRISFIALVIFTVSATSCTDHFTALNTPKNKINISDLNKNEIGQMFAQAEYYGTRNYARGRYFLYGGAWAQYISLIQPIFPTALFVEGGVYNNLFWEGFFGGWSGEAARQLNDVLSFTKEHDLPVANAIAKVWKVQLYDQITDFFGPIPYSHYGNGKTSVSFDSQKSIYMDFFKTLDDAVSVLKKNQGKTSFLRGSDLLYDGKVNQYLKWANSLRLRLAVRISYVDPQKAQQEAEKAMQAPGGVIINNTDNALLESTKNNINTISIVTYITEFVMSATMASILNGYHDPRRGSYFQQCCGRLNPTGSGYIGLRNGDPNRNLQMATDYSYIAKKWLPIGAGGSNPPERLMGAAEVYFLRAEGVLRGWQNMGGTAKELYDEGIRASLEARTDASDKEITNYIHSTRTPSAPQSKGGGLDQFNSPPVDNIPVAFASNANFETKLEQIITQKWIALYPNSIEAWAERRRTGYPRGYAIIKSNNPHISSTQLVRRVTYPPVVYDNNAKAVKDAVANLLGGPDRADTRLWWDAKPLADYPTPTDSQQ